MTLYEKFEFFRRGEIDDGYGNVRGDWISTLVTKAQISFRGGSEEVLASRLSGVQPAFLSIRNSLSAREIDTSFMCQNVRTLEKFAIKACTVDPVNRQFLKITVTSGIAEG